LCYDNCKKKNSCFNDFLHKNNWLFIRKFPIAAQRFRVSSAIFLHYVINHSISWLNAMKSADVIMAKFFISVLHIKHIVLILYIFLLYIIYYIKRFLYFVRFLYFTSYTWQFNDALFQISRDDTESRRFSYYFLRFLSKPIYFLACPTVSDDQMIYNKFKSNRSRMFSVHD
jgi:hypothetical protein